MQIVSTKPISKVELPNTQNTQNTQSTKVNLNSAQALRGQSFNHLFEAKLDESKQLQFSKHANMRLDSRNIALSTEQIKRVEDGVNKAFQKGIKDSLVFVDNIALVVNTKNKTVVTAMGNNNDNIFTNIDGAVIV